MDVYYQRYERILQAVEEHFQERAGKEPSGDLPPEFRGLKEEL